MIIPDVPSTSAAPLQEIDIVIQKNASDKLKVVKKCTTITPESVRPFPKVEKLIKKKRKMTGNEGKSRIYTETPEKKRIEELEQEKRLKKERKAADEEKKMLKKYGAMDQSQNISKKKQGKVKRRIFQATESEMSMSSLDEEDNLSIDDYVLVKFSTKTTHVHYIGKIIENIDKFNQFRIKFLRRRGKSNNFYYPAIEDIAICNKADILSKLK
ncbi:hypothetical protein MML48_8g00015997 [Holotrichia oblita]|uniref:Uncharacterized protein n=1 Tax=Holotrichia oblita TaxID=644536 RepID=A0ACB9SM52_HOLOL|nr:hypothetical protein MML48_8g00015997 [Holotrichia oblita]